jgi:3-deoxy-manno-octulosonate cytidylyltransferase (CMP-KDO synthetase)
MNALGIIPARYGSTRFPGKPLALINGISMIERVYNRAMESKLLSSVVVATDDDRIFNHVIAFGGKAVMTSTTHPSGTDRCAEVLSKSDENFDVVVNIQGDEPYIHPEQIDQLINCFNNTNCEIATLIKTITDVAELDNRNIPKVVVQQSGQALYFSRRAIPFCEESEKPILTEKGNFFKHIGIYGYKASLLPALAKLPKSKLEISESLEQLRWLENGYNIMTAITEHENIAVDTPEDVIKIEQKG